MSINRYLPKLIQWHTDKLFYSRAMKLLSGFMDSDDPVNPRPECPIIVIGMHRSGTSLVTRLLEDFGVFMGMRQGKKTSEDLFFRRRNELLFAVTHACWDNPSALTRVLEDPQWRKAFSKVILHDMESVSFLPDDSETLGQIISQGNSHIWGFKDPRSSITLPIWLDIFPNAKVIHVVRDGHAVASSLLQRGKRSLKRNKIPSLISLDPSLSLDLWAEYVMTAHKNCSALPDDKHLEIRYETLLKSPEETIRQILKFLSIDVNKDLVNKAVSRITHPQSPAHQISHISSKAQKVLDLYNYQHTQVSLTQKVD